ncbi:MAG TPA: DUF1028 domain-containing protein [Longimicrobiales bacterium]|nr:DUF1028 domain-containing protein [Longimicrobiales bacterium]
MRVPRPRTPLLPAVLALLLVALPAPLSATWSIIAVDVRTGLVVIASATCVSAEGLRSRGGLMSIQAVLVPGIGVAAAQAGVDDTRANQTLIFEQMRMGTDPDAILAMLSEDPRFQSRQFGLVDLQGRMAGFSGERNGYASLAVQSEVRGEGIYFAVQGNILESDDVVLDAVDAFLAAEGTVLDRVMAGMEAADEAGGDSRCSCRTDPVPDTEMRCRHRTAHVAYIAAARPEDETGGAHSGGTYSLFLDVDDENTLPTESPNPVETLRMRYDEWKAAGGLEMGDGGTP